MTATAPIRATCRSCDHCWIVAYLPMDARRLTLILRVAHCPMCGLSAREAGIVVEDAHAAP